MQRAVLVTRAAFALGMILLGVVGLVFPNFQAVWGSAPNGIPAQIALAYVCAVLALAAGLALLFPSTAAVASLVTFAYTALWWLLLKVPPVLKAPFSELPWLDCAMSGMLMAGAWILFVELGPRPLLARNRSMRLV